MKIALIYETKQVYHSGQYFLYAFQQLGHKVEHFDLNSLKDIPKTYDLYLRTDDGYYNFIWPQDIKERSTYWICDTHLKKPAKKMRKLSHSFGKCFFAHYTSGIKTLSKIKNFSEDFYWLPFACDPQIHASLQKKVNIEPIYDIAFVGNEGNIPRKFILHELRERYTKSYIGYADFRKMGTVYSYSKIGFNYSINNDLNSRIFEIMATGRMLITNNINDSKFLELFKNRENIVVYNNVEELFSLIEYYLKHEDEREAIALKGQNLVLSQHTYLHRAQEILKVCGLQ